MEWVDRSAGSDLTRFYAIAGSKHEHEVGIELCAWFDDERVRKKRICASEGYFGLHATGAGDGRYRLILARKARIKLSVL